MGFKTETKHWVQCDNCDAKGSENDPWYQARINGYEAAYNSVFCSEDCVKAYVNIKTRALKLSTASIHLKLYPKDEYHIGNTD